MNKVFLIGRLTKDPEIRVTTTGKKVASFSIAVNEGKDADGQEVTQFFNCTAWEKLGEVLENYTPKGTKVAIIGSLKNRSWDKPDGTKGYATEILVRELEILSSKSETDNLKNLKSQKSEGETNQKSVQGVEESEIGVVRGDELPEIDVDQLNVQMPF